MGLFFNIFVFLQVVDVLLNECSIIYECKVCFNLFRSISNFISHKRTFCKNKSQKVLHHFNNPDQETADKLVIVQPEPVETVFPGMQSRCLKPKIWILQEVTSCKIPWFYWWRLMQIKSMMQILLKCGLLKKSTL